MLKLTPRKMIDAGAHPFDPRCVCVRCVDRKEDLKLRGVQKFIDWANGSLGARTQRATEARVDLKRFAFQPIISTRIARSAGLKLRASYTEKDIAFGHARP